ncbi:glycoside hydrolase [Microthyrium microscopicum]|uniref:endo-polygalacturonase n=1 Tax=Microthyrium microscopicum TaxID=703497 RepID=A0A6A6UUA5_9PEZI|nr:glycoside hydrolase [Microthyrium microscopicum]
MAILTQITLFLLPILASAAESADARSLHRRRGGLQAFGGRCTVSDFSEVADAVKSCTEIGIKDMKVPGGQTLDLKKLKAGAKVTFSGRTTFEFADEDVDLIQISGRDITIQGTPGHVLDGNGPAWWDGIGSNGGATKPNHFIALKKVVGKSIVRDLYIENYPTHCFSTTGAQGLIMENIVLNNTLGDQPNAKSNGKPAGHNSDGFGFGSSDHVILRNSKVWNQDDCVAITSGTNITVENMFCSGGHGLSIGSVGGKSNNTVRDITFRNSVLEKQENGIRIKSNSGTKGEIRGIKFENIRMDKTTKYGIVIQQDYLNGGPTGTPTNGVKIADITIKNVTGTAESKAMNYYILCGEGSCSNFNINDVKITGGKKGDFCNFKAVGNFDCPNTRPAKSS